MSWTKTYSAQGDTLVAEIDRLSTPSPASIIAPSTVTMLQNAKVSLLAGEKNFALAEALTDRARHSPVFRPVLLSIAGELS